MKKLLGSFVITLSLLAANVASAAMPCCWPEEQPKAEQTSDDRSAMPCHALEAEESTPTANTGTDCQHCDCGTCGPMHALPASDGTMTQSFNARPDATFWHMPRSYIHLPPYAPPRALS